MQKSGQKVKTLKYKLKSFNCASPLPSKHIEISSNYKHIILDDNMFLIYNESNQHIINDKEYDKIKNSHLYNNDNFIDNMIELNFIKR